MDDENLSYLERKRRQAQPAEEEASPAKKHGVAASFRPKAKAKVVTEVKAKAKPLEPERSQIVQNVPQTRKLLATAIFELEELTANL
ncbi:MAG: hypothetical protein CMO80_22895 [Verrucomicrobiales bacterium]|nr:hypothetical protein [Verrucomicrobiales bacterium]|tara:strand:+ start:368 stop:628 length:261 start_codon:yes stop_codon:yes gene_type:complete